MKTFLVEHELDGTSFKAMLETKDNSHFSMVKDTLTVKIFDNVSRSEIDVTHFYKNDSQLMNFITEALIEVHLAQDYDFGDPRDDDKYYGVENF